MLLIAIVVLLIGIVVLLVAGTLSNSDRRVSNEIRDMYNFIHCSDVVYIRNGREYSVDAAINHIKRKHKRFHKKIKSTEDWIKYCATKSIMSGRYYMVRDGNIKMRCCDWLLKNLKKYRIKKE